MIYLLTFGYLLCLALAYDFGKTVVGKKFNYLMALILLVAIASFRYKVGGDTRNYMYFHELIPPLSGLMDYGNSREKYQPLWVLFSSIAKTFSPSFYALQIMQALVVNISVFVFFRRVTRYYFTGILVYSIGAYPYFNFEIMREALAISFFLWAFLAYRDGRWRVYYSFVAVAFLFHASALFLCLLPLLRRRQPPVIFAPLIFVAGIAFAPFLRGYLGAAGALGGTLGYASTYVDYTSTTRGLVSLFVLFVLFPLGMLQVSGLSNERRNAIRALAVTGIWVGATTSVFFIFFRLLNYFTPIFMVLVCEGIHRVYRARGSLSLRGLAATAFLLVVFVFYSFRYFSDTSSKAYDTRWYNYWYPYSSILDEREQQEREALLNSN